MPRYQCRGINRYIVSHWYLTIDTSTCRCVKHPMSRYQWRDINDLPLKTSVKSIDTSVKVEVSMDLTEVSTVSHWYLAIDTSTCRGFCLGMSRCLLKGGRGKARGMHTFAGSPISLYLEISRFSAGWGKHVWDEDGLHRPCRTCRCVQTCPCSLSPSPPVGFCPGLWH